MTQLQGLRVIRKTGEVRIQLKVCRAFGIQATGSKREIAFHEKAGWSQADSVVLLLDKVFSRPSRHHCRHPSIPRGSHLMRHKI
jgi:hypothetical protein